MDAMEEARSLKTDPLPPVIFAEPLTRVYQLDAEIERIRELLQEKSREREEALQYAIINNVTEDAICKLNIERPVRKSRTLNVEKFREVFPEEYMIACDLERKEKEAALEHIGERINITLVDKLVKRAALEAAEGVITVKESVSTSYTVVRK